MDALVVYESIYGLGGPTHMHGLATSSSRRMAVEGAKEDAHAAVAARGIARRLRRRGYEVIASESFLVEDAEGPLEDGELERARAWGQELAGRLSAAGAA
jgi:dienelactone hydrolase